MEEITLTGPEAYAITPVSNYFIDEIMPDANGEFVKIYLYLLRALLRPAPCFSICHIADQLHNTEKDVIRALNYWEHAGLIQLQRDQNDHLTGIRLLDSGCKSTPSTASAGTTMPLPRTQRDTSQFRDTRAVPAGVSTAAAGTPAVPSGVSVVSAGTPAVPSGTRSTEHYYSASRIAQLKENEDVVQLLYVAERYMKRQLSKSDVQTLLYIYDELHFPVELIIYLIEYCVSNNHTNHRYIEKTALNWAEDGIDSVEKAKESATMYTNVCYPILKAFGIQGRVPVKHEKDFIIKWTTTYGFSMDIILEACDRTMKNATPPSFNYADGILSRWHQKGIRTKADLVPLDEEHDKNKVLHTGKPKNKTSAPISPSSNRFNQFNQRNYDYEALEKELLGNVTSKTGG